MNSTLQRLAGPGSPDHPLIGGCPPPSDLASPHEKPDGRIVLLNEVGAIRGLVALWWDSVPGPGLTRAGAIGGFFATSESDTHALLNGACDWLREQGCSQIIGPMNANTWQRHRFVIETDGRPPYLLEPRNPPEWPDWWQSAGFTVLSRYSSSRLALDGEMSVPPALKQRLLRSGISIRALRPDAFDEELRIIHAISLKSFSSNFLYTPLDEAAFLRSYAKVRERVDPDLVRLAERDGVPLGFVFAIRDWEAIAQGMKPDLIVKTLAVCPDSHCAGLGSLLIDEVHEIARARGYDHAIHAMQHESNSSLRITQRHQGAVFRRYALFTRES
ncbi:MAG: hypothetical protein CFE26_12015 [Verrucomicrobiales bacterium VVV1]|nr:MAG: hypothetical protein CFE26_12015 [Verrucomicrobiales bacterium VVV1]